MQRLIIITLWLGTLLSCNFQNSTADPNTDRGKDGLKGEVVAVYHEYHYNTYFTEYDINGRKIRHIYFDDNNSKLPAEKQANFADGMVLERIYNYSKDSLESIDVINTSNFWTTVSKEYSEPASRKSSDEYEFTYDKKGNWIYKTSGDKVKTRQIFYIGDDYQSITSKIDSFRSALIAKDNGTFRPTYEEGVVMGNDIMQGQGFQKILDYLENKKKSSGTIEKIIFSDRAYYIGEVSNGAPNGEGKTIVRDKTFYIGQYVDGNFEGVGMVFYPDGNPYMQGNWKWNSQEGSTDGKGVQFDERENIVYSGDFKNFVPHGKGVFYNQLGVITYEGDVRNGEPYKGRSTSNSSAGLNGNDHVNCTYCGNSFRMKDGYVKTISSQTAYLGWTQIQNIESAKSLGYSQEIVNSLITNVKYGDWYCSKKCAYKDGVEAFDE